ncbi:MAG: YdcF family protein [Verrucomicrobia bacterium]|nr:YdcF family protein [Verrucomicrobiota bacterium]
MLFWLKKILTLPFLPLHFALMAGSAGIVLLFWTKRQKTGRALVTIAVLALAIFSNKGVARFLIAPLESQYAAIPEARSTSELPARIQACRTIVVLGGGHSDSTTLSRVNQLSSSALARLIEAVRLARLMPEAQVIVSGYNGPKTLSHAQILAEAAQSLGLAPERIIRLDTTRDTHDEALELARRLGSEPFLLVTSAWHMPRSMALCEKVGLHPIAVPTDFMLRQEVDSGWRILAWDLGALERSTKAIHERIGLFWSRLRGQS